MTKRSSAPARVLAVLALALSFVVLIALVSAALSDSGSSGGGSGGSGHGHSAAHESRQPKKTPATYTIQSGDTLISIAHKTGVPVAVIEKLNPGVDPQILISGEQLKLK